MVMTLLLSMYVYAVDKTDAVSGAATTALDIGSYTETSAGTDIAEGGNVTELNLTTDSSTIKWQGYVGSVSGNLYLGSGTSSLYSFGALPNGQIKSVFASTDASFNFGSLAAATAGNIDTTWAWNATDADSGTLTFDDTTATIAQVASVPVVNLVSYNAARSATTSTDFQAGVFKDDGSVSAAAYGTLAFGVTVRPGRYDYRNVSNIDYELIVPVSSAGVAGTQTYSFFLNIE